MTEARAIVIALDGPAASGKSSTAKAVARQLGYRHLDSGAFYRAITLAALDSGIEVDRWQHLSASDLSGLGVSADRGALGFEMKIDGNEVSERIRSAEVNRHVSIMAAIPAVRDWLLGALRTAAEAGGLVADGRDIGTVVFPDAELKVFLVCDPQERARRRLAESGVENPTSSELADETRRLLERDHQDETRAAAPLVRAEDAILLDTTGLDFNAQVRAITRLASERGASLPG